MELLEGIQSRRSVRDFTAEPVAREVLREILNAGHWAPSGLNNQPWRFVIVCDAQLRERLAGLTRYGRIVRGAPALLAVFLDRSASYAELKDLQGVGACLQNILLAAHARGLGAVWLGEILNQAAAVEALLQVPPEHALMAVITVGHPAHRRQTSQRRPLDEVIIGEF